MQLSICIGARRSIKEFPGERIKLITHLIVTGFIAFIFFIKGSPGLLGSFESFVILILLYGTTKKLLIPILSAEGFDLFQTLFVNAFSV